MDEISDKGLLKVYLWGVELRCSPIPKQDKDHIEDDGEDVPSYVHWVLLVWEWNTRVSVLFKT